MENIYFIYVGIGAFLLGMLFVAGILKDIMTGVNRASVIAAPSQGVNTDSKDIILIIIFLAAVVYFFSTRAEVNFGNLDTHKNDTEEGAEQESFEEEREANPGVLQANVQEYQSPSDIDITILDASNESKSNERSVSKERQKHEEYYLQVIAVKNEDSTPGLHYDYSILLGSEEYVHTTIGDDGIYRVLLGPFSHEEVLSKKNRFKGDILVNPIYQFLN